MASPQNTSQTTSPADDALAEIASIPNIPYDPGQDIYWLRIMAKLLTSVTSGQMQQGTALASQQTQLNAINTMTRQTRDNVAAASAAESEKLEAIRALLAGTLAVHLDGQNVTFTAPQGGLPVTFDQTALLSAINGATDEAVLAKVEQVRALLAAPLSVTGSIEVANDVGNPLPVSGSVSITGTPAVAVSGSVEIANDAGNPLPISGNVGITGTPSVTVSGAVEVNNDSGNPLPVAVTGTPAVTLSGTPTVSVTGSVEVANDAGNALPVSLTGTPAVSISGTPSVTVTGNVEVTNDVGNALPVVVTPNPLPVTTSKAQAGTASAPSRVTSTAATASLLAANAARMDGSTIVNEGPGVLLVRLGVGASATLYSAYLFPRGTMFLDGWKGAVSAYSPTSAVAVVTELSA